MLHSKVNERFCSGLEPSFKSFYSFRSLILRPLLCDCGVFFGNENFCRWFGYGCGFVWSYYRKRKKNEILPLVPLSLKILDLDKIFNLWNPDARNYPLDVKYLYKETTMNNTIAPPTVAIVSIHEPYLIR